MQIYRFCLAFIVCLGLAGCAGQVAEQDGEERDAQQVTLFKDRDKDVVIHSTFGSSDIRDWRALDDRTLIIDTHSHGKLVATLFSPCPGLPYTDVIGFSTLGPFDLDKYTTIILPDGERCHFKSLEPYMEPRR